MIKSVYTVAEIAAVLRVSTKTVYKLVQDQELPHIRIRGQIRITSYALENYLRGDNHNGETTTR